MLLAYTAQPYLIHRERQYLRADTILTPHPDRGEVFAPIEARTVEQWKQEMRTALEEGTR